MADLPIEILSITPYDERPRARIPIGGMVGPLTFGWPLIALLTVVATFRGCCTDR